MSQLQPGELYEAWTYAHCNGCKTKWRKLTECEAVEPGVYHRHVRDLGDWEVSPGAGTSFRVWDHYDFGEPECPNHIEEKSQLALF